MKWTKRMTNMLKVMMMMIMVQREAEREEKEEIATKIILLLVESLPGEEGELLKDGEDVGLRY
jgi:hypothetical protein